MKEIINKLNVSLIQFDVYWLDFQKNIKKIEKLIVNKKTDIILLPEMFLTGFNIKNPHKYALNWNSKEIEYFKNLAHKINAAIAGSIIFQENNKIFNRFMFFYPNKKIEFYDKRHRFTMADENKTFNAGKNIKTIEYKGWKIRLLICYDLRFPVWARNTDDYHLALYVANWPKSRIQQWQTLLKARAIENQAYVIAVNRIGTDNNGFIYGGSSMAVDYKGQIIKKMPKNTQMTTTVEIDLKKLLNARQKFPVLNDRDKFKLIF